MNIKLESGQALVLYGPQGSGKSTAAREVAAKHGPYREVIAEKLREPFGLACLADGQARTLIVDEATATDMQSPIVKALVRSEAMAIAVKNKELTTVRVPNLIFCTTDASAAELCRNDRRFHVVHAWPGR